MKKLPSIVPGPRDSGFRLRLAVSEDRENLRIWKNLHKQFYFHKVDITPEQQSAWFASYLARPDDHVYMVDESEGDTWVTVGVVAARLLPAEGTVDLYNIMRGARTAANRTKMGEALRTLCRAVRMGYPQPIMCKVLSDNPALDWYAGIGFVTAEDRVDHKLLRFEGDLSK